MIKKKKTRFAENSKQDNRINYNFVKKKTTRNLNYLQSESFYNNKKIQLNHKISYENAQK